VNGNRTYSYEKRDKSLIISDFVSINYELCISSGVHNNSKMYSQFYLLSELIIEY